jgi:hypothetical protein
MLAIPLVLFAIVDAVARTNVTGVMGPAFDRDLPRQRVDRVRHRADADTRNVLAELRPSARPAPSRSLWPVVLAVGWTMVTAAIVSSLL